MEQRSLLRSDEKYSLPEGKAIMRVRFQTKTSQADHLKQLGKGGMQVFHGAYGAGLGAMLGHYAVRRFVIPAVKGAAKGAALGALSEIGGSYHDKVKAARTSAIKGAALGAMKGKGVKRSAKRPF